MFCNLSEFYQLCARQGAGVASVLAMVCLVVGLSSGARADPVCVECEGPAQVYSCSLAPAATGTQPARSGRALQFACIQDVARHYGHKVCRVKELQLGTCSGQVHMITADTPTPAPATAMVNPGSAAATPVERTTSDEPKTVIELAKRSATETERELARSARTVSKAAKSTWRCVSSFFSDC